jgi:hypothetical protein
MPKRTRKSKRRGGASAHAASRRKNGTFRPPILHSLSGRHQGVDRYMNPNPPKPNNNTSAKRKAPPTPEELRRLMNNAYGREPKKSRGLSKGQTTLTSHFNKE